MKLKSQEETEIFISGAGYLVVKQENECEIYLSPEQAVAVGVFVRESMEEMLAQWGDGEE